MIYIVEKLVAGSAHVIYNTSITKVIALAFPGSAITFLGEQEHVRCVSQGFTAADRVRFKSIPLVQLGSGIIAKVSSTITRALADRRFFKKLFEEASSQPGGFVFICHIHPLSLLFLKKLKARFPGVKVILTLHGEVDYLFTRPVSGAGKRLARLYAKAFSLKTPNLYYLLLNKSAGARLTAEGWLMPQEILAITHPYAYTDTQPDEDAGVNREKLNIGYIGSVTGRKNGQYLFKLGSMLSNEIEADKIALHAIGPIEQDMKPYTNKWVTTLSDGQERIQRKAFEQRAAAMDYALFLFDNDQFIVRTSGAVFDAIECCKPLIVLKNDFFIDLFNGSGDIGYVCNSLDDIQSLIADIALSPASYHERYEQQKENIRKVKINNSLDQIAVDFKNQVNQT